MAVREWTRETNQGIEKLVESERHMQQKSMVPGTGAAPSIATGGKDAESFSPKGVMTTGKWVKSIKGIALNRLDLKQKTEGRECRNVRRKLYYLLIIGDQSLLYCTG